MNKTKLSFIPLLLMHGGWGQDTAEVWLGGDLAWLQ